MTRAEERALEAYPYKIEEHPKVMGGVITYDANKQPRISFQEGYEQAEKDLGWISVKDRIRYIEKIRHEIEFLKELNEGLYTEGDNSYYEGQDNACNHILAFIDSLPEEKCKDSLQVYETCKENTDSFTSLEEAAEDSWALYEYRETPQGLYSSCYRDGFIAGAKWMESQMPMPEDTVIFMKGVAEGRRLEREDREENKRKEDELPRFYGD